jgi:hypothetical protein
MWTHSHTKFMCFCHVQPIHPHDVRAHVYTPTYILFSFNTEKQAKYCSLLLTKCNHISVFSNRTIYTHRHTHTHARGGSTFPAVLKNQFVYSWFQRKAQSRTGRPPCFQFRLFSGFFWHKLIQTQFTATNGSCFRL